MRRPARNCALLCALALLAAVPLTASASGSTAGGPRAQAAHACHLSAYRQRHLGATYTYKLRVSGTRCRNAPKVIKAYNHCRHVQGGRDGRCYHRIYNYRCGEHRYNKLAGVSYDAHVRCRKSGREIAWYYTQNL
ncbi:MAG: hypothetical protein ABR581_05540 [Thermoleophilaceae bacterium]